jgi:hypothetical protein
VLVLYYGRWVVGVGKRKTMGWGGGWERGKGKGEGESEKEGKGWYLEHDLVDLDGVGGGAFAACADAGKGLRARDGVGDVGFVVGRVKVLAVPASSPARKAVVSINLGRQIKGYTRWIQNIRADAVAWPGGERFCIELGIGTRGTVVAAKVGAGIAAEARLGL